MCILYGMEQREDNSVAALGRVCSVLTPLLPPLAYNQCVCVVEAAAHLCREVGCQQLSSVICVCYLSIFFVTRGLLLAALFSGLYALAYPTITVFIFLCPFRVSVDYCVCIVSWYLIFISIILCKTTVAHNLY